MLLILFFHVFIVTLPYKLPNSKKLKFKKKTHQKCLKIINFIDLMNNIHNYIIMFFFFLHLQNFNLYIIKILHNFFHSLLCK
jgi:hypothetical protein